VWSQLVCGHITRRLPHNIPNWAPATGPLAGRQRGVPAGGVPFERIPRAGDAPQPGAAGRDKKVSKKDTGTKDCTYA
jgi:hypothetical protein